ncbi:WD40 repeat-like protein [Gonapodya prolifera JEL478]|uniref:WD40 repeat-like protein n=1 Tax=Gonapodya prolifera (strain JEL478) TaxID=1344416 RepID=A0A139A4Q6_GONPJ|nr:WD40 repeat-like protein [Gonapodya prolifera JEL478]|eukprot:KXS11475.1 WD40 repeat-like protein [Gonapodya prolifera JEL478]
MSATRTHNFAPAPGTNRGQYTQLSSDPKGENIVYTNGRSVFVRNLKNPEQSWEYTGHSATATVARFSPSGFYVASADVNGNVRIWDTINDEHLSKLEVRPISGKINDLAWDSESKRIIAVGDGRDKFGHAFLYDSGSSVGEIGGHSKAINGVSIRPVRPFKAVTASEDGTVNFFNGVPFKLATTLKDHTRFVHAAKFSPDGSHFVTVGADGKIFLYKGDTAEKLGDLNVDPDTHKGSILAVSWSPDSKHVVTSSADCTAKIWDVAAGKVVQTVTFSDKSTFLDQQVGNVWTAAGYIVSLSLSGDLNYLEVGSAKPTRVIKGHQKGITALAKVSPTNLYTGSYDGLVLRWDLTSGVPQPVQGAGHSNQVNDMVSVGGKVVTAGMDDTLRVIGEGGFDSAVVSTKTVPKAISSAGTLAVVASVGEVTVLRDGRKVSSLDIPYSGSAVGVHPSGATVAVGGEDGKIHTYAVDASGSLKEQGQPMDANKAPLTALAYSPDGSLLAAADTQRKVLVFEAASGKLKLDEWVFHTARVNALSWSPSGKRCVSGSLDTNVHVWSVDEPMKFVAIKGAHLDAVNGVTFLDEETVASGGQDGALRIWKLKY